ncbi:MAG: hypothetical protein ABIF85_07490 [Nanoarchaeota archaeon]|nr:hypothetical protein [Nanoarchaeota archaeon]MBU4452036.1 hypothetical protein [Nanoarchaeota archaeon]MCG2724392.1 hypothetical protein [archaeon]
MNSKAHSGKRAWFIGIFALFLFAYFAFAVPSITVDAPPTITANRTPLLNITFNETVNQSWFSIDT